MQDILSMKQGLNDKRLVDICGIQYGCPFDASLFSTSSSEGMPLIRIRDVKGGQTETYYSGEYSPEFIIRKGDYLIGMDGEFNIAPWQSEDALLNQRVCKIYTKSQDVVIRYVYRFLQKELKKIEDETPFVTVKHLSAKRLNQVYIPVPTIAEQEKIVAVLDCLSGIIEKKKQQLKELDNLAQSVFYEMFGDPVENDKGWKTINIENICSSIVRGPFGSALKKEFFVEQAPTTYKVYEQKHAIQKSADIGTYFIDAERFQTLKRFEVVPGDVIMSCSGTIGEFFVIPEGAERGIINQALLKYTLNDSIDLTYFLYVMEWVKENFDKKGTGLQNIGSVGTIKKTKISFPPLTLQQDFASKIESIEKQKELIAQSIKEVETLFNSRIELYFN